MDHPDDASDFSYTRSEVLHTDAARPDFDQPLTSVLETRRGSGQSSNYSSGLFERLSRYEYPQDRTRGENSAKRTLYSENASAEGVNPSTPETAPLAPTSSPFRGFQPPQPPSHADSPVRANRDSYMLGFSQFSAAPNSLVAQPVSVKVVNQEQGPAVRYTEAKNDASGSQADLELVISDRLNTIKLGKLATETPASTASKQAPHVLYNTNIEGPVPPRSHRRPNSEIISTSMIRDLETADQRKARRHQKRFSIQVSDDLDRLMESASSIRLELYTFLGTPETQNLENVHHLRVSLGDDPHLPELAMSSDSYETAYGYNTTSGLAISIPKRGLPPRPSADNVLRARKASSQIEKDLHERPELASIDDLDSHSSERYGREITAKPEKGHHSKWDLDKDSAFGHSSGDYSRDHDDFSRASNDYDISTDTPNASHETNAHLGLLGTGAVAGAVTGAAMASHTQGLENVTPEPSEFVRPDVELAPPSRAISQPHIMEERARQLLVRELPRQQLLRQLEGVAEPPYDKETPPTPPQHGFRPSQKLLARLLAPLAQQSTIVGSNGASSGIPEPEIPLGTPPVATTDAANDEMTQKNEDHDEDYYDIESPVVISQPSRAKSVRDNTKQHKKKPKRAKAKRVSGDPSALKPFSYSTLINLLESINGTIVGEEFNQLNLPVKEKQLIEKIVDSLSRLTSDMVLDRNRYEIGLQRLEKAHRVLEGFM